MRLSVSYFAKGLPSLIFFFYLILAFNYIVFDLSRLPTKTFFAYLAVAGFSIS